MAFEFGFALSSRAIDSAFVTQNHIRNMEFAQIMGGINKNSAAGRPELIEYFERKFYVVEFEHSNEIDISTALKQDNFCFIFVNDKSSLMNFLHEMSLKQNYSKPYSINDNAIELCAKIDAAIITPFGNFDYAELGALIFAQIDKMTEIWEVLKLNLPLLQRGSSAP